MEFSLTLLLYERGCNFFSFILEKISFKQELFIHKKLKLKFGSSLPEKIVKKQQHGNMSSNLKKCYKHIFRCGKRG